MEPPVPAAILDRLRSRTRLPKLPDKDDPQRLRRWNVSAFVLHLASAVTVLVLANDVSLPINAAWPCDAPGRREMCEVHHLGDVRIAYLAAGFALLSALAHFSVATFARRKYEHDLKHGINQLRWLEYSLSSTLMIVTIGGLTGINELAAIIGIAGCNVSMILFGWAFEREARRGREHGYEPEWFAFWAGCVAALAPWIAIVAYALGSPNLPGFVWGILVSLFALFNCFALVMYLEYRTIGPFARVAFAERAYIVLSFTAKVALTWQIAANTLL